MIRNSDILFGRMAATYQFTSKENILQAIKEVSALQVLGIEKRIYQILYERGYLNQDQVYAVLESLLQSQQIKKIKESFVFSFTQQDDKRLYDYLGIPYVPHQGEEELSLLAKQLQDKKLPFSLEELLLCLNIKNSLYKAGISCFLITIINDKKLLKENLNDFFADFSQRGFLLVSPKDRSKSRIRKSEALLFSQIALAKGKMAEKDKEKALFAWQSLEDSQLPIKYSELLFYMNLMDEQTASKIASTLYSLSGINQNPRFALFRLTEEEEKYFQFLLEKERIPKEYREKANNTLMRSLQEGLTKIRLSDIMLLQKSLSRKNIVRKYLHSKKNAIEKEVQKLQLDKTEEAEIGNIKRTKMISDELSRTEEVLNEAEKEEKKYVAKSFFKKLQKSQEDDGFEKELDETFTTTQEQKKKELFDEVKKWKANLKNADEQHAQHLSSMIERYNKSKKKLQLAITAAIIIIMVFAGYCIASLNPAPAPIVPVKQPVVVENKTKEPVEVDWEKFFTEIILLRASYKYQKAIEMYQKYEKEIQTPEIRQKIRKEILDLQLQSTLFEALGNIIRQSKEPIYFIFRDSQQSFIKKISEDGILLAFPQEQAEVQIEWKDIKPQEVYKIFKEHRILKIYPWELSLFCCEHKLVEEAREALAFYIKLFPTEKQKAWNLLSMLRGKSLDEVYQEHDGKLYSHTEKPPIKFTPALPKQTEEAPKISWNVFYSLQNRMLLEKREQYSKEQKEKGHLFMKERWTSPALADYEKQVEIALQEKKIYFKGQWQSKEKLGKWHELILKKQRQKVCGFLLPIKDIYELRTESGISYLNEMQILEKKETPYPEERYWKERTLLSDKEIKEHIWLQEWAFHQGIEKAVNIQWEKILTMAPDYPAARKNLGYIRHQGQWKEENSIVEQDVLVFPFLAVDIKDAERLGLAKQKKPVLFIEENALQKASTRKKETQSEDGIDSAEEKFIKVLEKMPQQLLAIWKKGRMHLLHEEYWQSGKCFQRILHSRPDFSLAWVDRGNMKFSLGNSTGALQDYSKALSLDENLYAAYLSRGMLYQKQKKQEQALNDFIQAYTLKPENLSVYYALARFYWETGKKKQALSLVQQSSDKLTDRNEATMLLKDLERISQGAFPSKKLTKESNHCMIVGDCEEIFLEVAAYWLDAMYCQYCKILGSTLSQKLRLSVFSNWDAMREYLRMESPYIWNIAKAWSVTDEIVVSIDQHPVLWKSFLFQECLKHLTSQEEIPFWLWEALQAYFFYYPERENGISWEKVSPYILLHIQENLAVFSLTDLLSMDEDAFLIPENYWKNGLQAYAWLHFFIHAKEGNHLPLLHKYCKDYKKNREKNADFFAPEEKNTLIRDFQEYWQK